MPRQQKQDMPEILHQSMGIMSYAQAERIEKALDHIPDAWRLLDVRVPIEPKKKRINFYMDEDVHMFFAKGTVNWQERVRMILRNYVSLRVSRFFGQARPSATAVVDMMMPKNVDCYYWEVLKLAKDMEDIERGKVEGAILKIAQAIAEYTQICQSFAEIPDIRAQIEKLRAQALDKGEVDELHAQWRQEVLEQAQRGL